MVNDPGIVKEILAEALACAMLGFTHGIYCNPV
jgi:hypothetical protein